MHSFIAHCFLTVDVMWPATEAHCDFPTMMDYEAQQTFSPLTCIRVFHHIQRERNLGKVAVSGLFPL